MGLGPLPQEPLRTPSASDELQRPEHRRVATSRGLTAKERATARMARARWAEELVASFYAHNGYEIVARNWHCREGELDIVATRRNNPSLIIVIIEVKARATNNFGSPLEAVTLAKQRKLRIATKKFLQSRPEISGEVRFDIAAVLGTKIEVLENAF